MNINSHVGNVNIRINTDRLDNNLREAQKRLNMLVVSDSTPYIPFQQGQLRSQVRYPDGIYGGSVEWYSPYAHYQYEGELYLTATGSSYARAGEVKYPSGRPLNYHTAGTGKEWFEQAKINHKNEWIRQIKDIVGDA